MVEVSMPKIEIKKERPAPPKISTYVREYRWIIYFSKLSLRTFLQP